MPGVGAVAALTSCLVACLASPAAAASLTTTPLRPASTVGGEYESAHRTPAGAIPANVTFADDELQDSKKQGASGRLEQGCTAEGCQAHCRQRLHAAGRCDAELCVCRDLRQRGRCLQIGFGCGEAADGDAAARMNNIINNNNNNVIVLH